MSETFLFRAMLHPNSPANRACARRSPGSMRGCEEATTPPAEPRTTSTTRASGAPASAKEARHVSCPFAHAYRRKVPSTLLQLELHSACGAGCAALPSVEQHGTCSGHVLIKKFKLRASKLNKATKTIQALQKYAKTSAYQTLT